MTRSAAKFVREYGPFPGVSRVHGVTFDGKDVWLAAGDKLLAFDPETGQPRREVEVHCPAGAAFDGTHFFQVASGQINKIDPGSGRIIATIPAPTESDNSGLAWAEGFLWVGQWGGRKIHQIDPSTGEVLRTIESKRFVTGVTWVDGELWHGTNEGGESDLRRVDTETGEVSEVLPLPKGFSSSGLESDGGDRFYCGGGASGKVCAVERPKRAQAPKRR